MITGEPQFVTSVDLRECYDQLTSSDLTPHLNLSVSIDSFVESP